MGRRKAGDSLCVGEGGLLEHRGKMPNATLRQQAEAMSGAGQDHHFLGARLFSDREDFFVLFSRAPAFFLVFLLLRLLAALLLRWRCRSAGASILLVPIVHSCRHGGAHAGAEQ